MDIPKSKGRDGFWEAYRGCAEENRVRPDRSPFYVNWAKDFANFLPEKPFPEQCMVQAPSSIQPRSSYYGRTLSKKGTRVKIFWVVSSVPS
jgi:hypothetical protein